MLRSSTAAIAEREARQLQQYCSKPSRKRRLQNSRQTWVPGFGFLAFLYSGRRWEEFSRVLEPTCAWEIDMASGYEKIPLWKGNIALLAIFAIDSSLTFLPVHVWRTVLRHWAVYLLGG